MHIHDFHSKLTSGNEPSVLFQALRNLSLVEDTRSVFEAQSDNILVDWVSWPPSGGETYTAALAA